MTHEASGSVMSAPYTLMLLGGGIRFPAYIGALQALEEKKLPVAKIVGSSSGAIIGALYAAGMSTEELRHEALAVDTSCFKDISLTSILTGYGLCSGNRLEAWLDAKLEGRRFGDQLLQPLKIIATDMLNYKPVIFSAESFPEVKLSMAARCSVGVPWVFACRRYAGQMGNYALVDGSLMAGVVERMMERTEKTLILKVLSKRTLNRPGAGSLSMSKYFREMMNFFIHAQEKEFIKGGKWKETILLYCGNISPARFVLTTKEKQYLIEQGYEQTMKYLSYKLGV